MNKSGVSLRYSIAAVALANLLIFLFPKLKDFDIEYLFVLIQTTLGAISGFMGVIETFIKVKTSKIEQSTQPVEVAEPAPVAK
jgi:hypothetical protein